MIQWNECGLSQWLENLFDTPIAKNYIAKHFAQQVKN